LPRGGDAAPDFAQLHPGYACLLGRRFDQIVYTCDDISEFTAMFNRQTLFIVGAGSSAEVGFPVGKALAHNIGKKMDIRFERGYDHVGTGDYNLFSHVTHLRPQERDAFQDAAFLIRDGIVFAQSIDDFLDQHRSNPYVNLYGKAAIVQAVVEAERESKLYFDRYSGVETFDAENIANSWLVKFMYMLGRGVTRENVHQIFDRVSFIIFNYDRCIEHFLTNALHRLYGITLNDAVAIIEDLSIVHPYGAVAPLSQVPFGATRLNCVALADGIKTYTEQSRTSEVIGEIAVEVARAECIIFLGFAFHSQNIQILRPPERIPAKSIYGTAFGMSDADVDVVSHALAGFLKPIMDSRTRANKIRLENKLKCGDLFDYYAKSLSGGD
jgi:hypothetical protein